MLATRCRTYDVVAVADVFDALSSRRSYKKAFPLDECFQIMLESRGTHFAPIVDAFLELRPAFAEVAQRFAEA